MINTKQQDRVMGVIFGQAIGDALGVGTTRMTRTDVRATYPDWLLGYSDIMPDEYRKHFVPGAWTNNTDQMLVVLDSIIQYKRIELPDIARRLHQWAQRAPFLGNNTKAVLTASGYVNDPQTTARYIWERSKRLWAGNDGIVRTAISGVWDFEDPIAVQHHAAEVCKLTHFDPRCVGSSVIMALVISALISGSENERAIVSTAYEIAAQFDERMVDYVERAVEGELGALHLDEGLEEDETQVHASSYTLKAMGVGLWVMMHAPSFRDGLLEIIHEGGDAHNNGAMAGAVLGAKFGYEAIPADWINGLANYYDLLTRTETLLAAYR